MAHYERIKRNKANLLNSNSRRAEWKITMKIIFPLMI
jgi:hypothetical protein